MPTGLISVKRCLQTLLISRWKFQVETRHIVPTLLLCSQGALQCPFPSFSIDIVLFVDQASRFLADELMRRPIESEVVPIISLDSDIVFVVEFHYQNKCSLGLIHFPDRKSVV